MKNSIIDMHSVATLLRPIVDFPKPGILFWDITPLLRNPVAMERCIQKLTAYWASCEIEVIAGFDARGFIFGPLLAHKMGLPFEQIRKKGKLPGETIGQEYGLEYRKKDVIEVIDDGFLSGKRILLIDDLLATGGTAEAGCKLVERLNGTVVGFSSIVEIPHLGGRAKLQNYPVHSLVSIIENTVVAEVEYCVDIIAQNPTNADELVLIERLTEPRGIALPGGRIDPREAALAAAVRELKEETGYHADKQTRYLETRTSLNRDPRGVKVSLVYFTHCSGSGHAGEKGKTIVVHSDVRLTGQRKPFVFDSLEIIRTHMQH